MEATTDQIATVAALNDIARRTMGVTCRTVITQGIAALDENTQSDILKMIEGFEDFTPDNDPHGEHDAGFLYRDVIGQWHTRWTDDSTRPALSVMWKFYYDRDLEFGSAEPWNPDATTRVLTILLTSEY